MDGIADYRFLRSLWPGNYGSYFLALTPERLPTTDEQVVVKVLVRPSGETGFRRAVRELQAFAATSSPFLVSLYDAGQEDGAFYYAMEYLPLGTLAEPARRLERAQSLRAVEHAARAAHALHEAGLVHRDVRPGNVHLTDEGGKLSDLGLAHMFAPDLTMTGLGLPSSIEFLDPALLRGGRASRSTDIWSLGATLHWALSGSGLYAQLPDHDPLLAMRRMLSTTAVINSALDAPSASVVGRCIDPDPQARPRTAEAVADLIARLV